MKAKLIIALALMLCGSLIGCSTPKGGLEIQKETRLPIKFAGYRELYIFIAHQVDEDFPTDNHTLFKLAADSTTKIVTLDSKEIPYVYLIENHYYNGGIYDQMRGAHGNGSFFVVRPLANNDAALDTDKGFELVGILSGNVYELTHINGKPRFTTYWHISAGEHPKTDYDWNGKYFEQVK